MTGLTQGKIALIISTTLLVVQWICMLWMYYQYEEFHKFFFIIPLISSFIVYFLTLTLVEYFILRKIRILYRTVSSIGKKPNRNSLEDPELFEKLREQIELFKLEKYSEIEALKENEKFRREFIGNVSHELKTPLFSIQGFLGILLDDATLEREIHEKYLQKISKNTDRLIQIVEDLTLISQAENQQLNLNWTKFHIYELCSEVIDSLEEFAKPKKIKIEIKDTRHFGYIVRADRQKISQVLYNLIENAIFYCPESSRIEIRFFDLDTNILVEVSDNGHGIEKEHLHRIFERFYRIDDNRSREKGGSGLGLSIVKNIVEAHNQSIRVESEVGKGSTFYFTLDKHLSLFSEK